MNHNVTQRIVNKAWNFAHVLRDDGLSYMAYTKQISFLLFLKMAHERTKVLYHEKPIVPVELGWGSLLKRDGDELEVHYRHILDELSKNANHASGSCPSLSTPGASRRWMPFPQLMIFM